MRRSVLHSHLASFDGRNTDVLERVAAALDQEANAVGTLIDFAEQDPDAPDATAATWVLLRLCKQRQTASFDAAAITRLASLLTNTSQWEPRLHILQALARVDVQSALKPRQRESLARRVMPLARDAKPFVAAWALNLLGQLGGGLSPAVQVTIAPLIHAAERDGPASVRARMRQLRRSGALAWLAARPSS